MAPFEPHSDLWHGLLVRHRRCCRYKFDRLELLDLDEDGDLDVLTCEKRDNLGVIWYEIQLDLYPRNPQ